MLVSTALVLLMTPALGFFYGGLVRSKNALNTMMMSFVSHGPGGRGVGAARLLARLCARRRPRSARCAFAGLRGVGMQAQGRDSAPAVHGVSGHVRHHHRGADLRRRRRALALQRVSRVHRALGALRLCAGGALGLGRRLSGDDGRARFCRRRGRACERRGGGAGGRARRRRRARTTGGTRCCRTTCRSRCSAPACSGSDGSGSTPAARSRQARRRPWRLPTRCSRRRPRWPRGR